MTDSLPALALSVDPADKNIMRRKPIDPKQGILTRGVTIRIVLQSMLIAVAVLGACMIGLQVSVEVARTMTFATLAFSQMTLIFSIRSGKRLAFSSLLSNGYLLGAIAVVVGLMLVVMLVPSLQTIFHVVPLNAAQWLWIAGLSLGVFFISEIAKLFVKRDN